MPEDSVSRKPARGKNCLVGGTGKFKHFNTGLPWRGGIVKYYVTVFRGLNIDSF